MGKVIDKEDEVIEIVFNEKEINNLVDKLKELIDNKTHIHFGISDNSHLLIHHEDDELLK